MSYEISSETLLILPMGDNESKIIEKNKTFIVNLSPKIIIDESCKFFGSSYEGRFNGTKQILGISHKAPIIIEETRNIIFFPTTSPRLNSCVWISLNNIETYEKKGIDTKIKFFCGKEVILQLSYGIVDNQVLRATRLSAILSNRKQMV